MMDSIDILKRLLLRNNTECPFLGEYLCINLQEIIVLAQHNKCTDALFHFIECARCRNTLDSKSIKLLAQLKFLAKFRYGFLLKEQKQLKAIASQNEMRLVYYKNNPNKIKPNTQKNSADIDVLVTPETQKKLRSLYKQIGYAQKTYPPKEISLFHKKFPVSIDLHTLVVYPHYGDLRKERLASVRRLSEEMYSNASKNGRTGVIELNKPYYLVFLSIYFWYNDLGFGLSTLYTFLEVLKKSSDADLDEVVLKTKKHKLYSLFSFIVSLAFQYFKIEIPDKLTNRFKLKNRQKTIILLFSKNFIIKKSLIKDWHSENKKFLDMYLDYYITDLILDDAVPMIRLVRPKIVIFYIRSLFELLIQGYRFRFRG